MWAKRNASGSRADTQTSNPVSSRYKPTKGAAIAQAVDTHELVFVYQLNPDDQAKPLSIARECALTCVSSSASAR